MEYAFQKELSSDDIRRIRKKLNIRQKDLAELVNVSVKTVEHWESGKTEVKGAAAVLLWLLEEHPQLKTELEIPVRGKKLRLRYLCGNRLCTTIDVDSKHQIIEIKNYTSDPVFRAFGRNENPTYEDYEKFLESRCFPRTRDKIKIQLKELNLPFYDPFLIIEKTQGRMAGDRFWIQIERAGI